MSNFGSIPARGENACKFTRAVDQNLQFATANPIAAHIFHSHLSVPPTDMEAPRRNVGLSTNAGASIKFGINPCPW